jgi:hypothetical protein
MRASSYPTRRPDVKTYVLPDGTALLFDPVVEGGLPLDVLSSLIWDYCDGALSADEILDSPYALIGTVDEMVEDLEARRRRWNISYILTHEPYLEALAPVVKRLAGR